MFKGCLLLLIFAIGLVLFFRRRKQKPENEPSSCENNYVPSYTQPKTSQAVTDGMYEVPDEELHTSSNRKALELNGSSNVRYMEARARASHEVCLHFSKLIFISCLLRLSA